MRHRKGRLVGIVASALAMVLTLASVVLPKAFADGDYFVTNEASIDYGAAERTVTIELKANQAFTLYGIEGNFAVGSASTALLTEMTPSSALTSIVAPSENSITDGKIYWLNAAQGATFAAGDVVWSATYTVASELAAGDYSLPISLEAFSFGSSISDMHEDVDVSAKITVVMPLQDQELSFDNASVEKHWEDDNFTIVANHTTGDGAVTYDSTNKNVATVDTTTGEVTIVGVGETNIVATAAETSAYAEATASYGLTVNKKVVSISSAGISDKTYDGTTAAEVSSVVLSKEGLDYDSSAAFADANAGTGKTATVTVTLTGDSAAHYELTSSTYDVTATISRFAVTSTNVLVPTDPIYYSGSANEPDVIVMVQLNGADDTTLVPGTDFDVTYPEDSVTAGEKTLTVTTKGNYTDGGNLAATYTVSPHTLTNSNISLEYATVRYSGEAKTPTVSVMIGEFKVDDDEYTVGYSDDNINPGPVTVTVTAKANKNIAGSATAEFEIIDKEVLSITGISSQSVTYTGLPVSLVGTLTVGANADNITVSDLTTKWYASDGATEISQPTSVGSYKVVYSYNGVNYAGTLEVPFEITKATSPQPVEITTDFRVVAGTVLSAIPGTRTTGFAWTVPTTTVTAGSHNYPATYTYDNDTTNYTTLNLNVPVYGLTSIAVSATVDGDGGAVVAPDEALEGDVVTFAFAPAADYEIDKVILNNSDVTSSVVNNELKVTAGTADMNLTVAYHKVYVVTEGDGESYDVDKGQSATFRIDADLTLFTAGGKVYVDGVLVSEDNYSYTSGSTVITLNEGFIATLSSGNHTMSVVFSDGGVARANFTVSNPKKDAEVKSPDTGFFTGSASAKIAGFTAALVTLAGLAIVLKKKFSKSKIDFDKK